MNSSPIQPLLLPDDPSPVRVVNPQGSSTFLLLGDHAGNRIPRALGTLGISESDIDRHIGWDIGIAELGEKLAEKLNATFLSQTYSRLVIDCNRDPTSLEAMPGSSDGTYLPGNINLSSEDRYQRISEIHAPYQRAIEDELAAREKVDQPTILVSLHSFTPFLDGAVRPWDIGVLYSDGETGFARALLAHLANQADLTVGDNQPYAMDATDHTIPRHAFKPHLHYAEIEIRQDLLADNGMCERWSELLANALISAARPAVWGTKTS